MNINIYFFLILLFLSFDLKSQCTAYFKFLVNGNNVDFVNSSTGSYSYEVWDFGDGNTNDISSKPSHVYSQPGSYMACLSIYDGNGVFCDSICFKININTSSLFYLEDDITIYPNPFQYYIKINSKFELHDIFLYDIKGRLIKKFNNLNSKEFVLMRDSLDSGIYNLKIIGKNITLNKKILII